MVAVVPVPLTWTVMQSRFPGKCSECGAYIAGAERIAWNSSTKATRCGSCYDWTEWTSRQIQMVSGRTVSGQIALHLQTASGVRKRLAGHLAEQRAEDKHNDSGWGAMRIDLGRKARMETARRQHRWLIDRVRTIMSQ